MRRSDAGSCGSSAPAGSAVAASRAAAVSRTAHRAMGHASMVDANGSPNVRGSSLRGHPAAPMSGLENGAVPSRTWTNTAVFDGS